MRFGVCILLIGYLGQVVNAWCEGPELVHNYGYMVTGIGIGIIFTVSLLNRRARQQEWEERARSTRARISGDKHDVD